MSHKNSPTETQKILSAMLKENTGRHMLDSGGSSGRHWQRNQARDFLQEPDASLEISAKHKEILVYINLFHYLDARLEYDKKLSELLAQFAERESEKYESWDDTQNRFVQWLDAGQPKEGQESGRGKYKGLVDLSNARSFYTYNDENMLNQDFVCTELSIDGEMYAFIQIHNGADARGGFTAPKIFRLCNDGGLYDYDRATISCENRHWWDYDGRNWDNDEGLPNLEDFDILSHDEIAAQEGVEDIQVLAERQKEYDTLVKNQSSLFAKVFGAPKNLTIVPNNKQTIIIDADDKPHCPICGSILSANAPCA